MSRKVKNENEKLLSRIIDEKIFALRQMRKDINDERPISELMDERFLRQRLDEMTKPLMNYKRNQALKNEGV